MSRNAHKKKVNNLDLVEFDVFTKICSLSSRLVIPMLQIVIKQLK